MKASTLAALFDLRSVIALLFGVYGLVLTLLGALGTGPADLDKAGGVHLNLWTGIAMLAVAAGFVLWVWLRPPVVAAPSEPSDDTDARPGGH
ncbi:hypothetical protein [Pseudonocardia humida]|uniref:Uncharacterized protein n=1 Tax=Pseudonocardia humida TaxID=2800819 RepID=A0ABT0ZUA9_9PSEU|nr:hypothetical protein [Pseudonocardia humida]MCO1654316.1 hypothetical protein [Pseudonocardia humida]